MNQNKKRLPKLTFAGKLMVSSVVAFAIIIASSLYNNALQRSIKREIEVVQKDVDAIKELNIEMKAQLNILQEQKAIDRFSGLDFVDGPTESKQVIFTNYWSGEVINTLVADIKSTSCTHPDGSVIEFLVDSTEMKSNIKQSGNYNDVFSGTISRI